MTAKAPAFQFYVHDFLAGRVATYSLEDIGAYTLLLAYEWALTGLPVDAESLAKLCRVSQRKFKAIWPNISGQFIEIDGTLFHPRLCKEREKQQLWRDKSSKGGKTSAEHRAKGGSKGGATVVEPPSSPNVNTPSPSPTPVTTKIKGPAATPRATKPANDTEKVVAASTLERFPETTCNAAYDRWAAKIGALNYGALRKAIQPAFDAQPRVYGPDQLANAVDAFSEAMQADDPKWRDKWTERKFARELHHWVRLGAMELVDEWGSPTERGRASGVYGD